MQVHMSAILAWAFLQQTISALYTQRSIFIILSDIYTMYNILLRSSSISISLGLYSPTLWECVQKLVPCVYLYRISSLWWAIMPQGIILFILLVSYIFPQARFYGRLHCYRMLYLMLVLNVTQRESILKIYAQKIIQKQGNCACIMSA